MSTVDAGRNRAADTLGTWPYAQSSTACDRALAADGHWKCHVGALTTIIATGPRVVTATPDGQAKVWNMTTKPVPATSDSFGAVVTAVTTLGHDLVVVGLADSSLAIFHSVPDGLRLASFSVPVFLPEDETDELGLAAFESRKHMLRHVTCLATTPQHEIVAVGSWIRIWDGAALAAQMAMEIEDWVERLVPIIWWYVRLDRSL